MVTLLLVRHGYSLANKENFFAGQKDIPLCDLGFKQAERVCDYIKSNFKVDAIYSSPLSRSVETVKALAQDLSIPLFLEEDLKEVCGGEWEGKNFSDIEKNYSEYYTHWTKNKGVVCCPNGESMQQAGTRALKALEKICLNNDGKTLVIASHGGVLRTIQCFLSNVGIENFNDVPWTPNACISIVEFDNGKFTPKVFGFTDHLKDLLTNLPNI